MVRAKTALGQLCVMIGGAASPSSTGVAGAQSLFVGNSGQGLLDQLRAIMQLLQRGADLVGLNLGAALSGLGKLDDAWMVASETSSPMDAC